jgi:hypothetical protein
VLSLPSGIRGIRRTAPVVLATLAAVAVAVPASASALATTDTNAASTGLFSCFANPLRITGAGQPGPNTNQLCKNDQVGGAQSTGTAGAVQVTATGVAGTTSVSGGGAAAGAAGVSTEAATTASGAATATAKSAKLVVGKNVIELGAMSTQTTITCTYDAKGARFSFNSRSSVGSLKINGKPVTVANGASSVKLSNGTLYLNHTSITATGITQHAAMLHTAGVDVAVGEAAVAVANTPKNPCHP